MGIRFTADEVLEVAQAIEANAVRFYEAAAVAVREEDSRRLLSDLARWEKLHERAFAEMRAALPQGDEDLSVLDPDQAAADYLRALADATVFRSDQDPLLRLGPEPECRRVLEAAVELEKESIVFYARMRDLVPLAGGKSRVGAILAEENQHVAILTEELSRL